MSPDFAAISALADYRAELSTASRRNLEALGKFPPDQLLLKKKHIVYTHSLIDSVVYPTVRLYHMLNSGSVDEAEVIRWQMMLNMSALLLTDSWTFDDPVVFLRGHGSDDKLGTEEFYNDVEIAILDTLETFKIPFVPFSIELQAADYILNRLSESEDNGDAHEEFAAPISGKD